MCVGWLLFLSEWRQIKESCELEGKSPEGKDWHIKSSLTFPCNVEWRWHNCGWQFIYDTLGFTTVDTQIMKYKSTTLDPVSWEIRFGKSDMRYFIRIRSRAHVPNSVKIQSFSKLSNHENYIILYDTIWIEHTLLIFTNKQHNNKRYTYRR